MIQNHWMVWAAKAGTVWAGLASLAWVADYLRLSHGDGWRNLLMRTYIYKALIIAGLMAITAASLFLNFNRHTSQASAWLDVVFIGGIGPLLTWRMVLQRQVFRRGREIHPRCPHCGADLSAPAPLPGKAAS